MTTSSAPTSTSSGPRAPFAENLSPRAWLIIGVVITALVGMRWNIGLLAWVAPTPFLIHLRLTQGWRARLWLLGAIQVGTALQIAKIVTEPVSWAFVPMFSVPMALSMWILLLIFERLRCRLGDRWGLALFPALVVVREWAGWRTSEFGSWGASAYTQLENLPLLQTVSLVGLAGISLLTGLVGAWVAVVLTTNRPKVWLREGFAIAVLVLVAHAWGSVRLFTSSLGPMVTVAAIVSDIHPSPSGFPKGDTLVRGTDELFSRTRLAAERGARVIAWNEGATVVEKTMEPAFIERGQALARELSVDLVLAYIVPLDGMRRFENKYLWLGHEGNVVETYLKHHPVPGEGSVRGEAPIQVLDRPYGQVAGAICYDYDFPTMAARHAQLGAGLVIVPSSDWRGIDPYHTQMAGIRAIEGGFSVVRPVRWATSAAYDAYGRTRATMSFFESNDRIMLAQVPVLPVQTLYARTGDMLPLACSGVIGAAVVAVIIRRRSKAKQINGQG